MFNSYTLNEAGKKHVREYKNAMANTLTVALSMIPEGRNKEIMRMKLEEAIFFGTSAISKQAEYQTEIIQYGNVNESATH